MTQETSSADSTTTPPVAAKKKYKVDFENAPKLREWLDKGRGICVWSNKDLGDHRCGDLSFTPGDRQVSPHWQLGTHPDLITHDRTLFEVEKVKEVKRVNVRRGPPCYGYVTKADYPRLSKAVADAGKGAFYIFNVGNTEPPWVEAIVMIPDSVEPL